MSDTPQSTTETPVSNDVTADIDDRSQNHAPGPGRTLRGPEGAFLELKCAIISLITPRFGGCHRLVGSGHRRARQRPLATIVVNVDRGRHLGHRLCHRHLISCHLFQG